MRAEQNLLAIVREVTDEEVAFYQEYGWVMMKQLVDPDFASELLRVGQAWRETQSDDSPAAGLAKQEDTEPYRSFMFSKRMAANATRLVNRKRLKGVDVPLRYRVDILGLKPPGAAGSTYHQDSSEHGSDRVGELQFWLALVEVPPEMRSGIAVDGEFLPDSSILTCIPMLYSLTIHSTLKDYAKELPRKF